MVRRQASADPGTCPDAGQRRALDPTFGDDLGCRFQQGIFGPAAPFGLAPSGRWSASFYATYLFASQQASTVVVSPGRANEAAPAAKTDSVA